MTVALVNTGLARVVVTVGFVNHRVAGPGVVAVDELYENRVL